MKGLINLGLLCLLGVFVIIIMAKTPMIRSFFGEGFTAQRVTMSQCPRGYKMYMYDGKALCCNGTVNTTAQTTEKSCLLPVTQDGVGFCTLGGDMKTPSGTAVPNCSSIIAENLTKQGRAICPPSKPNFCMANRCCTQTTPDGSDCANMTAGSFCDVLDPSKRFTSTTDCNYLRMKEMDTCPGNTNKGDINVTTGALAGLTIYGCSTLNTTCYTDTVLAALKSMGKDTTGLTSCSGSEVPSFCYSGGNLLGKKDNRHGFPTIGYTKEECEKLNGKNSPDCLVNDNDLIARYPNRSISSVEMYYAVNCLSAADKAKLPEHLKVPTRKIENGKIVPI